MYNPRFLIMLDVVILNLLDEGRKTYSLYRICVLSLMIVVALRSTFFSYRAVRLDGLKPVILLVVFTMRCKVFLSF